MELKDHEVGCTCDGVEMKVSLPHYKANQGKLKLLEGQKDRPKTVEKYLSGEKVKAEEAAKKITEKTK